MSRSPSVCLVVPFSVCRAVLEQCVAHLPLPRLLSPRAVVRSLRTGPRVLHKFGRGSWPLLEYLLKFLSSLNSYNLYIDRQHSYITGKLPIPSHLSKIQLFMPDKGYNDTFVNLTRKKGVTWNRSRVNGPTSNLEIFFLTGKDRRHFRKTGCNHAVVRCRMATNKKLSDVPELYP